MLQRNYEDFAKKLYAEFPDIEESSIDDIADYGLKRIYHYIKNGEDVFLKDSKFFAFIGESKKDSEAQWNESKLKEHSKRRKMFKETGKHWDGWHYFGLTQEENEEFSEKGVISEINLYKLIKESAIRKGIKFIYRTKLGYTIPENEILWMEKRENYKREDCEISEEGTIWLNKRNKIKSI